MSNACFRCRTSIGSGGTFCSDCRDVVTFDGFEYTATSRLWIAVAALGALQFVGAVAGAVAAYLAGADVGVATALVVGFVMTFLLSPFLAYVLLKDAGHVRARDDVDWSPSRATYWLFAFLTMFVVPTPLVVGVHLRKRRATTGLPVRKTGT